MLPSIRLPLPQPPPAAGGVRAMFGIILHVFLFSSTTSQALDWLGPRPTPTQSSLPDIQGWTPKPTDAPRLPHQQHHHAALANTNLELKRLFRRQAQSKYPNTCGYVDGNEYYSFTCSGAYACAYHVDNFAFGCCTGTSTASDGYVYFTDPCYIDTSTTGCYGYTETSLCTGTCTISALVCSSADAPVCRTVLQLGTASNDPVTYTEYDCMARGAKTFLTIQNYYSFSSYMTLAPLLDPDYTWDGTTYVPLASATTGSGSSRSGSADRVTTASSSPTLPPPPPPPEKKSKTGAIAGGVVGGLAGLGLLAGALIWALKRKKEKARREAASVPEVSHVTYVHDGK